MTLPLPIFPNFKSLDLTDKKAIVAFGSKRKPYSDFNFTNLWTWDTLSNRKVCQLNGNLVILFTDYRSTEPFLSFLGETETIDTALKIIDFAETNKLPEKLKFISEEIADTLYDSPLFVEDDQENFDYIFSTKQLAESLEPKLKNKRRLAKSFSKNYPEARVIIGDFSDPIVHDQIIEVMYCWRDKKKTLNKVSDIEHEELALKRLFESCGNYNLILTSLYFKDKMIGFSIDEILNNSYAISHFIKADINYRGVYEYINESVAEQLLLAGCELWNWEQDLNIEGLRQLKQSYRPINYLKKYVVSKK